VISRKTSKTLTIAGSRSNEGHRRSVRELGPNIVLEASERANA
jgi:hypothetical protein